MEHNNIKATPNFWAPTTWGAIHELTAQEIYNKLNPSDDEIPPLVDISEDDTLPLSDPDEECIVSPSNKSLVYQNCSQEELCIIATTLNEIIIELKEQNDLLKKQLKQHESNNVISYIDDVVQIKPFEKIDKALKKLPKDNQNIKCSEPPYTASKLLDGLYVDSYQYVADEICEENYSEDEELIINI